MPTPIELIIDPISLIIFALYGGLMLWEALAPGTTLPRVPFWRLRGLVAFTVFFFLSSYLPLWWDAYLAPYQLLDLTGLGDVAGAVAAVAAYELLVYVWHRAMHRSPRLWRAFHQMHHSAERLDSYGAFYFSPMDMVGWSLLGSLALVLGVGVTPQAATITILVTTFLGMFQHANVRTPRWLGYFVQRPESHRVHHARGVHRHNYSDLPIFDMLFGTFRNPEGHTFQTGFAQGDSGRVLEMLCMKDIALNEPERPSRPEVVRPAA